MRPAGEIRAVLSEVMGQHRAPVTTRTLAALACTGLEATRRTLDNMVRAGIARKAAEPARVAGVKRPVPLYELAELVGALA